MSRYNSALSIENGHNNVRSHDEDYVDTFPVPTHITPSKDMRNAHVTKIAHRTSYIGKRI